MAKTIGEKKRYLRITQAAPTAANKGVTMLRMARVKLSMGKYRKPTDKAKIKSTRAARRSLSGKVRLNPK